jgi:hypothetical protein
MAGALKSPHQHIPVHFIILYQQNGLVDMSHDFKPNTG